MNRLRYLFQASNGKSHAATFALVCTLFLLWGFCNGLLDILNSKFQESLHIGKMESGFVQFAAYIGYFVMAVPSGLLAKRFGYKGGILIGLTLIAIGSFWFIPATHIGTFSVFLLGLFILATGLTCLETIANPYTTVLGPPEMGATRINLAQTCNAVGTILGPYIGGYLVFSSAKSSTLDNNTIYLPYMLVGIVVLVLGVLFFISPIPELHAQEESVGAITTTPVGKPLFQRWHFVLAIAAQFLYVAAQTGIWSYFVNYIISSDMPNLSQNLTQHLPHDWRPNLVDGEGHFTKLGATRLLAFGGFVLFLIGRFSGSKILQSCRAHTTLAVFGACNIVMMLLVVFPFGWMSVAGLFLSFFFMSIMYPTIFALGIHGLGERTKLASSLIVMAIVGGAVMPLLMGWLADTFSMRTGFIMPLVCFVFITAYAAFWPLLERTDAGHAVEA
jgi:FHS family L-fucose permease-like MFS transporter